MANWTRMVPDPARPGAVRLVADDGTVSPLVLEEQARRVPLAADPGALALAGPSYYAPPPSQQPKSDTGWRITPEPTPAPPPAPVQDVDPALIEAEAKKLSAQRQAEQDAIQTQALGELGFKFVPQAPSGPAPIGMQRNVRQQTIIPEGAQEQLAGARKDYVGSLESSRNQIDTLGKQRDDEIGRIQSEARDAQAQGLAELRTTQRQLENERIDPNRFWAAKSTGQKVMSAIGIGLGAIGAAMTRSPNAAMEIFQDAVNKDIEAQKVRLNQLNISADRKQQLLDRHAQLSWRAIEQTAQRFGSKIQDEEQKLKFDGMIAAIREKEAAEAAARDTTQTTTMTQSPIYAQRGQPVQSQTPAQANPIDPAVLAALTPEERAAYMARNPQPSPAPAMRAPGQSAASKPAESSMPKGKWTPEDRERMKATLDQWAERRRRYVPALGGYISGTDTQAHELNKVLPKAVEVQAHINEIRRLSAGTGEDMPLSERKKKIEVLLSKLHLDEKDVENLGVLAGPDMGILKDLTGAIGTWNNLATNDMLTRLNTLDGILSRGRARLRSTLGVVPGRVRVVKDPWGRSHEYPEITGSPEQIVESATGREPGQ